MSNERKKRTSTTDVFSQANLDKLKKGTAHDSAIVRLALECWQECPRTGAGLVEEIRNTTRAILFVYCRITPGTASLDHYEERRSRLTREPKPGDSPRDLTEWHSVSRHAFESYDADVCCSPHKRHEIARRILAQLISLASPAALKEKEELVLRVLAKAPGKLWRNYDIAGALELEKNSLSDGTISRILTSLINQGFAECPKGPHSGAMITEFGKTALIAAKPLTKNERQLH